MVKPLKDILAEIEERQPVRRFQAGGMGGPDEEQGSMAGDETPSDPGQDDTLGEEDEGPGPDISEEQSEPSDALIQAINDLYSLEDPVTREDTLSSLPPDPRNNIVSGGMGTDVLKGQAGDKDRLGKDKEDGFFDGVNPLASLIESLISFFTLGAVDVQLDKGDLLGKDWSTGKTQPQGSVQLGIPSINPAMTMAGLVAPQVQIGPGGVELVGGPQRALDMVANVGKEAVGWVTDPKAQAIQTVASVKDSFQNLDEKLSGEVMDDQGKKVDTVALTRADLPSKQNQQVAQAPLSKSDTTTPAFGESEPYPDPSPASLLATKIVENAVVDPDKKEEEQVANWSFDPATWYPVAQGGPIAAFSPGGLAGMMNRGMMDNQLMAQQPLRFDPYSGNRPARPPQHGVFGLQATPRPPQLPGFVGPFGPQRPPQQPRLEPETYYHEHEGGKVTYPNFPKPFVNPPTDRNPIKDPDRKSFFDKPNVVWDPAPDRPFKPVDETGMPEPYSPLEPVPPISISETTATAMEPEAVEEATQTTIEEARPVPREIDIQMPENVTATLDFPEEVTGTANYRWGGLADIGRSLAPMAAGWALGPMGYIPGMLGGAATSYALAGRKRGGLDAIKGALMGYSGVGLGRVGEAYQLASQGAGATPQSIVAPSGTKGVGTALQEQLKGGLDYKGPMAENIFRMPKGDWTTRIGNQASGLWNALATGRGDVYKALGSELIGPASAAVGAAGITPPSEMPEFTEIEIEQIKTMTPEERKQWLANRRKKYADSPLMRTQTFTPPDVDIGWQPNFAAEGGVMEIDEEMESGSFVLPADVVSNVGDGSSDAGHRRLTELFGGGDDDEYALGGGTGILKGPIKGPGSGLDDLIQTGIDGVRVARLSTDEFVVPKDVVRRLGEGSTKAGSEKLYDFMKDVRLKKHGTTEQPKEIHMSGLRKMV